MPLSAAIAVVTISVALWIRRITWSAKQEKAITVNVALQGIAVVGMLPLTAISIGQYIYELTGEANIPNLIAHDCYIVAASMILFTGLYMATDDDGELRRTFRRRVELPCTLIIPVLVFLFMESRADDAPTRDFFALNGGAWLCAYWLILTGTISYALAYALWMFRRLITEPGFRLLMALYIAATAFGIAACAIKATTAVLAVDAAITAPWVWWTASLCGAIFAVTSAREWSRYVRWMSQPSRSRISA